MKSGLSSGGVTAAEARGWQAALGVWNALVFVAWATVPFIAAGTVRWPAGWTYLAVVAAGLLAHGAFVRRRNPDLRRTRSRLVAGAKRWDLAWNFLLWPLLAAGPAAAGLEVRAQRGDLSLSLWPIGAALFSAGMAASAWAMSVNPFFEGVVRVQENQRVVEAGPYRFVRHPGNLGLLLWALASPFLLRSRWAFLPALGAVLWIVLRTAIEDMTLRRELAGYEDYARRVRFRLIPGAW